jgi:hypothetical protein
MINFPGSYPNLRYPGLVRMPLGIKNSIREPPSLTMEDETALTISRALDSLNVIPLDLGPVNLALSDYNFSWRELPYGREWDAFRIKRLSDCWVSIK